MHLFFFVSVPVWGLATLEPMTAVLKLDLEEAE
jgi:hypothetical protein